MHQCHVFNHSCNSSWYSLNIFIRAKKLSEVGLWEISRLSLKKRRRKTPPLSWNPPTLPPPILIISRHVSCHNMWNWKKWKWKQKNLGGKHTKSEERKSTLPSHHTSSWYLNMMNMIKVKMKTNKWKWRERKKLQEIADQVWWKEEKNLPSYDVS